MENIGNYKNRFYNLIESTMGDVKPLIVEDEQNCEDKEPYPALPAWKNFVNQMKSRGFTESKPEVTCGGRESTLYSVSTDLINNTFNYVQYSPDSGSRGSKIKDRMTLNYKIKGLEYRWENGEPTWLGHPQLWTEIQPMDDNEQLNDCLQWLLKECDKLLEKK